MKRYFFIRLPLVLLGSLLSFVSLAEPEKPTVLVSIEPLAAIAKALIGAQANVISLLEVGVSPHDYALKPSQLSLLHSADLIIWVDPEFEFFMAKAVQGLDNKEKEILQLSQLAELDWPSEPLTEPAMALGNRLVRDQSIDQRATGNVKDNKGHNNGHSHLSKDFHLWLNPSNAQVVARAVVHSFGRANGVDNTDIESNLRSFITNLDELTKYWRTKFDLVNTKAYAVYHRAYGHFEQAFGLIPAGFVTQVPDERISGKKLLSLKNELSGAQCLVVDITEVQQAHKMGRLLGLPLIEVNILGASLDNSLSPSFITYSSYFNAIAGQIYRCLQIEA